MNYIARLTSELGDARAQLDAARAELNDLLVYLGSSKFTSAPDADHVHVRTDLMPKLVALRLTLSQ
jgi:hypothetical protein